ncbi:MAG: glycosyltransferase family 2 protein [Chloroflexi bacterium]|nr:glycosyltransferase family 2 protein [Chloroflexota bacterium]
MVTSLTVSMPAYNEELNIKPMVDMVLTKVGPLVDDLEVIIVDDGSKDRTAAVVEEIAALDPRVRLIRHPVNMGYGAAVKDSIWAAGKEFILTTDSDLQFDLGEVARFLPHMLTADMVAGYRRSRSDPWYRRLFGNGWSWLVNLLFGYTARDVDCAFKLFKRRIIETITVQSGGAMFSAEFLVRTKQAGFIIVEEPVSHYPRKAGSQTGARMHVILRAFKELFKLRWRMWKTK